MNTDQLSALIIESTEIAAEEKFDNAAEVRAMLASKSEDVLANLLLWTDATNEDEGPAIMFILSEAANENSPFLVEAMLYAYSDFVNISTSTADEDDRWGRIHFNAAGNLMSCFGALELEKLGTCPQPSDFELMIAAGYADSAGVSRQDWRDDNFENKADYVAAFSALLPHMETVKKYAHQFLTLTVAAQYAEVEASLESFIAATLYLERATGGDTDQMDALIAERGGDALVLEAMGNHPSPVTAEGVL
jgi:hypothetical protein